MRHVLPVPRRLPITFVLLTAALPAAAQVARSDVPTFPSAEWFDTGGDGVGGVSPPKFDILNVHTAFLDVNGEETAFFRYTTGEHKDRVSSTIGTAGYLDTDFQSNDPYEYETRFFVIATELYEGAQPGSAEDSVLVVQRWSDSTLQWEGVSFHTYSSGSDLTGARPEADGGGCANNDASCTGWLFDTNVDLSPSHPVAADRQGIIVVAMTMNELGATRPPLLMPLSYNATAPLSEPSRSVALNIFSEGNPCNDPAEPYYDASTGQCTSNSSFDWKDHPDGETAFATPVSIDLIERVPGGLRVHLVSVQGPTFLQLWWQSEQGALEETNVELAVRSAGVHTLLEDSDRAGGRYVVVDRGLQHVFGAYAEDGERLDGQLGVRSRLQRDAPRPTRGQRDRTLGLGRASARDNLSTPNGPLHFVDVGAEGGLLRVPADVNGASVSALWLDGERHLAFACAVGARCVLVPPSDATRTRPVHRAAVIELGPGRPVVDAPRGARGEAALLVERVRLPTTGDVSQWPYPLEHAWALTWLATPWLPSDQVVLDLPAAELVAIELEASSKESAAEDVHALTLALDGVMVEDIRFRGPRAQLRIALDTSHAGGPAVLTVETREREGGGRELMALTGAVLEHARAPVVGDGFYALVRQAGTVSLDEDALVVRRDSASRERAWRVPAGRALSVDEGDELAVFALDELDSAPRAEVYRAPSPNELADADVVVLVGAAGGASAARAALEPWTSSWSAHGRDVLVAPFAAVAAALATTPDQGVERAVSFLGSQPSGPDAVVIVGSATPVPERELPDGAFHVPAPRRWHAGYTSSSDAAPALDVAATGGRLMPVTRVPVVSLVELQAVGARLAAAAAVDAPPRVLVVTDGGEELGDAALSIATGARSSMLDAALVDAHALGRVEGARQARQGALAGVGALWYVGHGSFAGLGRNLLYPTHLREWASAGAPPLTLIANTCYAGNLAGYGQDRMPDLLFRWDTPVRAALLGAGHLDLATHRSVSGALTAAAASHHEIGSLWAAAMRVLLDEGVSPDELAAYPLLGDPVAPVR